MFVGYFTGEQALVAVYATDDGKSVYSVVALFDGSQEWKTLVKTYDYYKDLYTRKYGEPASSNENNPARSDYNLDLMRELNDGTVEYVSEWEVIGGEIDISIINIGLYRGSVAICYRNAQNVEARIQNELDDI